jgi:4-diphosphocytidyl-2-C-methyl-D-erythritol kinase
MICEEQFKLQNDKLLVLAPAKINLSLLIGPKRPDNYHEVHTVMAKINLCDELYFEKTDEPQVQLACLGQYSVPAGPENIVYKAAKLLSIERGLKITLIKKIPAGAGLAGGSSDAAAALMGINKICNLGLTQHRLADLAASLGSDVPFFLSGPLALCTGRGEKISEIPLKFNFSALLVTPDINVSTKSVYENFTPNIPLFESQKNKINEHLSKNRIDLIVKMCANMLELSCFKLNPKLADLKKHIESLNIGKVCLSGSGSTMFVLTGDNSSFFDGNEPEQKLQDAIGHKVVLVSNNRW